MASRAPHNKAILLYGAPGTGKTMLAHAIAHDAGATLLDLSPGVTDGLYPGKKGAALLVQMVFRAARAFAPSVILIDGCEKVSFRSAQKASQTVCLNPPTMEAADYFKAGSQSCL